ncbi:hypothetical protein BDM02DRAFT_3109992 [Thelephora ganbajun]|uniref:Uncharacterized protein n=1 Tax=Thelephora ganbajun TaxID=370292 RepID=A0ACB6ZR18_THEGA|nr:hypothetical protein BDM02DRAFT_3109992 [Thelephora ganbajun]
MATPLQYFQSSPVRGQLEPPDATTRPGWRYLQCTDTPNELKVLLPPRASQVYAYLLSQEQVELAKGAEASWERLIHVRHLKDRMIRKCRRLARLSLAHGKEPQYRSIYAPPDFTLKELEKWYRNRHDANNAPPSLIQKTRKPHASSKHSHGTRGASGKHRATVSRRSSQSGLSYAEESHYPEQTERSYFSDDDQEKTLPSVPAESFIHVEHQDAMPGRIPWVSDTELDASRPDVMSPDPIPMPYRPRESTLSELHDQYQFAGRLPNPHDQIPPIDVVPPSEPSVTMPEPSVPEVAFPMPIPQTAEATLDRPPLARKRSNLKRSNSRSSLKTVSWALNETGKSRYATAVEEIVYAGEELDSARIAHKEEIILLQDLHRNVIEVKERLRLDEERVRLEQQKLVDAEEAVRHQEERLRSTFEQLELHEGRYQAKVTSALDEASRSLSNNHRRGDTIQEVQEPPV